ncbi:toll/interleukin-1 receptor domain-containing protein [Actinoplanes sp. NPDC049548]|uniref:toll/interleukin-1 receptor domain-containing protein n=1 Tax=Actinoplanes sp. NPDC049548 TaxID=3155152 RepID=UPI0034217E44
MGGIFINYRTADAALGAVLVDERLVARFGPEAVFRDQRSIPVATRFDTLLWRRLRSADVVLALIGPHWLEPGDSGAPALHDPQDFVRRELAEALRLGIDVCPVLLGDDTPLPRADELPRGLKSLPRHQYARVRTRDPGPDVDQLVRRLADRPDLAALSPPAARQPRPRSAEAAGVTVYGSVHAGEDVVFGGKTEHHYHHGTGA